ncbi:MAG TPA: hypothetical protein VK003_11090 [Oceanobacillus sp.]|nr:hypothetical protein [Oceanobacillus sp.]
MLSESSIKLFVVMLYVVGLAMALVWLSQGGAFAAAISAFTLTASLLIFWVQHQDQE